MDSVSSVTGTALSFSGLDKFGRNRYLCNEFSLIHIVDFYFISDHD